MSRLLFRFHRLAEPTLGPPFCDEKNQGQETEKQRHLLSNIQHAL
jgi:hypothetical protein